VSNSEQNKLLLSELRHSYWYLLEVILQQRSQHTNLEVVFYR
jgi:hypothetical protein